MNRYAWLQLTMVALISFGCNPSCNPLMETSDKNSYKDKVGYDFRRLPLLKPYYALDANMGLWHLDFSRKYDPPTQLGPIGPILAINVSGDKIYGYCAGITYRYQNQPEIKDSVYFILQPNKQDSNFFSVDRNQYLHRLMEFNINADSVYPPFELYETFAKTGRLHWFPQD